MSLELQTFITELLPSTRGFRLTELTIAEESVRLQLAATAPTACCPCCTAPSSSVHSPYQRYLTDLPWGTRPVRLHLTVRKFICRNAACVRQIFTERLPDLPASLAGVTAVLIALLGILALVGAILRQ
jgi:transposase